MSEQRAPGPALLGAAQHCFVVPPLTGPITGGTLYNRELVAALQALGSVRVLDLSAPELGAALGATENVWVDSLYLTAVPALKRQARGRLGLIVHYLPSFVALGRVAASAELSPAERAALRSADAFLVTSAFMRDALEALVAPNQKPIFVVEPGSRAELALAPGDAAELRAVLIGNLVPGKGIEPWLRALAAALAESDRLHVSIVGSLVAEPDYAASCQRLVLESPLLARCVSFLGPLSPSETWALLARAGVFVSASRMESFGMALSEAKVMGVPILARAGGNTAAHIDRNAGGELVATDAELARACLEMARDPTLLRERVTRARAHAPRAKSWHSAAEGFAAQLAAWEK
jgi:glycosyltransferase involved in cell wall biosynthesis